VTPPTYFPGIMALTTRIYAPALHQQ